MLLLALYSFFTCLLYHILICLTVNLSVFLNPVKNATRILMRALLNIRELED